MPVLRNARRIKVMLAVVGAIGLASVAAYIYRLKSAPAPQMPSPPVQTPGQSADQTDGEEFLLSEQVPLGSLLGYNKPALTPIIMSVGPPPGEADTPNLSTPAVALHSVLSLIDQAATDELTLCFIEEAGDTASNLYPRYLGHPIELVDVVEQGESAGVIWNATVHTEFSLDGESRSPGETIALTTRLLRVEGIWKILKLHDGVKYGPQQHDTQAN
jgi:hypothetical protein